MGVDGPGEVLFALLFDLDVEEDEGVHAEICVLLDAVVEAVWLPRLGEEHEGDRLSEVV